MIAEKKAHTVKAVAAHPKVSLRGISKTFRWKRKGQHQEIQALYGVDLDIEAGEFVSVIGPSGCGKTTLLRVVAGLIGHDEGEVLIDDRPVTGPGPERAMVFQTFGLFPWKTVIGNVKFPLVIRKVPDEEADEIARRQLKNVGLEGFEDVLPRQLSGGMQQRVGLARALVTDPATLLMDEPFGSIDAQTRELMQEELLQLWLGSDMTVMFVTHDLDEAVILADRVVVLSRGPGKVRSSVPVNLPRPRFDYDVRAHPRFAEVRAEIWAILRSELVATERDTDVV